MDPFGAKNEQCTRPDTPQCAINALTGQSKSAAAVLLDDAECIDFALRSRIQAGRGSRREESILTYAEVGQVNFVSSANDLVKPKIYNVILRSAGLVKNSASDGSEFSAIPLFPEMQELILRG